jgi:hypothetical protein
MNYKSIAKQIQKVIDFESPLENIVEWLEQQDEDNLVAESIDELADEYSCDKG